MHGTGGARVALVLAAVVVCLLVVEADAAAAARARRGRALRRAARRVAGRDGLRVQAPLRRQRHVGLAADARPERRLRLGRPHDHDDVGGDDGAVPGDPRRLLGERRLLVGLRVLEPVGRPRERRGPISSRGTPDRDASRRSTSASTREPVAANVDVDSYIAQAAARRRASTSKGRFLDDAARREIVFPDRPWRADWVTSRPVSATAGRARAARAHQGLSRRGTARAGAANADAWRCCAPERNIAADRRSRSNAGHLAARCGRWTRVQQVVTVCVPPQRAREVTIRVHRRVADPRRPEERSRRSRSREPAACSSGRSRSPTSSGASCAPSR